MSDYDPIDYRYLCEVKDAEIAALKAEVKRLNAVIDHHTERHAYFQGEAEMWESSAASKERKIESLKAKLENLQRAGRSLVNDRYGKNWRKFLSVLNDTEEKLGNKKEFNQ